MSSTHLRYLISRIPAGPLTADCFTLDQAPLPVPQEGEVLLKVRYMSIDAASRAWMQGATYRDALASGALMAGRSIGEVMASRHPDFSVGDVAFAETGWQEYAVLPAQALLKQPTMQPLSHLLSIYGVSGLTAYFGLVEVGQAKAGETVVVSAAAGAVGHFVGQIAKVLGCRVVGIAGSDAKCRWLTETLGFDVAISYKTDNLAPQLKQACPKGIDVYFDNVGGQTLETVLPQMNMHGRIACCGAVAVYDQAQADSGIQGVPFHVVVKRLTLQGFIVSDFFAKRAEALEQLRQWVQAGKIQVVEDVVDGFESLPGALVGLLHGDNRGKRLVRLE